MIELQQIIALKRELLGRETCSRSPINYSEGMAEDQKDRFIQYLAEQHREDELTKKAMELVLEDFMARQKELDEKMSVLMSEHSFLKAELLEKDRRLKAAERENRSLRERLGQANEERYGEKRQRVRKRKDSGEAEKPEADRNGEKDDFDGTEGSLRTDSVDTGCPQPESAAPQQERDLSNRPNTYKRTGVAGTPLYHPSDKSKVHGRILETKFVHLFSLRMFLIEECYEMVHYVKPGQKPQWGYFPTAGHPEVVMRFEGTKATPELLQAIAYEVYVKNVTFGSLHHWLTDMGMTISANTLRNWLKKGKKYLDQVVLQLKEMALEKESIVHCDETWCKVRKYDRYKKCYVWVLVNKARKVAIFFYEDGSRGRDVLTDFLGDAELKSVMSDGYNAYVFIGDEMKSVKFKDTVHQVCMAHARNKFVQAANRGGEANAALFVDDMKELFYKERQYDKAGLSPGERLRERQGLPTKEVVIRIRSRLDSELSKEAEFRSPCYTKALNYLKHFWNEIFAYLQDGELPIDNNLAERVIRKLTIQRNNSLHYGSDEGAKMASTYHSVISTVKLHGGSTWEYIGTFFKNIFNGCRDYVNLVPGRIAMTTCQR